MLWLIFSSNVLPEGISPVAKFIINKNINPIIIDVLKVWPGEHFALPPPLMRHKMGISQGKISEIKLIRTLTEYQIKNQ